MQELKPCPFCGGSATLCAEGIATLRFQVICDSCLCGTGYCGSADKIKDTWNRRATVREIIDLEWPDLRAETQTVLTWAHNVMMCCQGLPVDDSLEFPVKVWYLRILCESVRALEKAQSDRMLNFIKAKTDIEGGQS